MSWPEESGSLGVIRAEKPPSRRRGGVRSRCFTQAAMRGTYYLDARGLYRVFNAAEYRFYRSNTGPPTEGNTPFATSTTLPHTPADTYADGTWYLSASYFNGVIGSGFLPLGPHGETYLRLDLAGGQAAGAPPSGPADFRLELLAGGVVRVVAVYCETGENRAEQWAIAYTTNGADPPAGDPAISQEITGGILDVLAYDLPAQSHGTTVKVRLQTRRDDSGWVYSEDSVILTATADAQGPAAPESAERWSGRLSENL